MPTQVPAALVSEAIRFRLEVGLRADEAFVRSVFVDPLASSEAYGTPMLPVEEAELDQRAIAAQEVAEVIQEVGSRNPATFGGTYIDGATGIVYGVFTADLAGPRAAVRTMVSPLARFEIVPGRNSLADLDRLMTALLREKEWLASIGAPFRGAGVWVEENRVELILGGIPAGGQNAVLDHFGVEPTALSITIDPDILPSLPRGRVEGRIVDASGQPVLGRNFDVVAVGDIGSYEPDGGVGIATDVDGTFVIERIAEMGWQITVRDPVNQAAIGTSHIMVHGGETTKVDVVVTP